MPDTAIQFEPSLRDLGKAEWIAEVRDLVDDYGYLSKLGTKHIATFAEDSSTLLVTFESLQGIHALSPLAHPLGWEMVKSRRFSHLGLISDGDTWFRDPAVYGFFDRLVDDAFFDEFDKVLFYGAGPCGYAAAAYSVTSPGARVLAIQPQATLAADLTDWDNRFTHMRRTNFERRYGYAPDMLDGAEQAYILYDPSEIEDAMHAALFTRSNVVKLRLRHMGSALQSDILQMGMLFELMESAANGRLDTRSFAELARARRQHLPYLRRLLSRLEAEDRVHLTKALCRSVTERMRAPRFARRLKALEDAQAI